MGRLQLIGAVIALAALTASSALAGDSDTAFLEQVLAERLPGVTIEHISPSPVSGFYQAVTDDGREVKKLQSTELQADSMSRMPLERRLRRSATAAAERGSKM